MCKSYGITLVAVLALVAAGCGKTSIGTDGARTETPTADTPAVATTRSDVQADGPAAAVSEFLDALRKGNEEKAVRLLSSQAREKTAGLNRNLTPGASDTAKFTVGKVEMVNDDGARVASTWTDFDEDGQLKTDEQIWVTRREAAGWRVAGVAVTVFPGEPPLILSFEDPEDMLRKNQWAHEEIRRRAEKEQTQLQTREAEKTEKPARR
ncbi:MAG: hypothetical protein ABFC96_09340 [Thermoguttaceae bacterium]